MAEGSSSFWQNKSAVAALAVAAVLGVLVLLLATSDTGRTGSVNFEILGEVAPQIEGETLSGDQFDLREQRGDWVVVNFFASWCVGCRIEHPELVEFTERHRDGGPKLVSVMFSDTVQNGREFFDELGGDWPTLVEGTGPTVIDYGVTAVPETVLVSPSGRVVQKWLGANGVTADEIDTAILRLEGGS